MGCVYDVNVKSLLLCGRLNVSYIKSHESSIWFELVMVSNFRSYTVNRRGPVSPLKELQAIDR